MFGIQNCGIKSLANYLQLSSERDCQQLNHSSLSRSKDHVCDGLVLVLHGCEQQAGSVPQQDGAIDVTGGKEVRVRVELPVLDKVD